eukprot:GEMP01078097.1.p1 GENE.GEMP01078097.1~~GEMP01078097.1.p1  ORF type:complete len:240 (+),score=39.96 GEMP01078097.1:284-1003(+)
MFVDRLEEECVVLTGAFALFMQGVLFVISALTLVVKWKMEVPPRSFAVFLRDSSKQITGAGVLHCWNLSLAMLFTNIHKSARGADECSWYWTNIMLDTTFGVWVCYAFLRLSEKWIGYNSGKYSAEILSGTKSVSDEEERRSLMSDEKVEEIARPGSTFAVDTWTFQILIWCTVVSLMKIVVFIVMWVGAPVLVYASVIGTSWVPGGQDMRLIFVMIITPVTMNTVQFWIQDNFLKWKE